MLVGPAGRGLLAGSPCVAALTGGATMLVIGTALFVIERVRAKKRTQSVRASETRAPTTTWISTAASGGL